MINRIKLALRSLKYRYRLDPIEVKLAMDMLSPGDIAIDIGCPQRRLHLLDAQIGRLQRPHLQF
jgi:hypothetical protein